MVKNGMGWMKEGWVDEGRKDGWAGGWVRGLMDGCTDGRTDGWINGCKRGRSIDPWETLHFRVDFSKSTPFIYTT